ncbi:methionine aminotransferase [Paraflavisolibacter sp. H34]|uniref:methionine aminotransferase n=1 Tax=Huijunlia imazamoxiresistens TaxID=3127457 RepID=UPI0030160187
MIHSKLPQVGTTIFTVMSSLAQEHGAINLGQGFPDFPMNGELVELVSKAMRDGHNQYTHMAGYPPLRAAIAEKIAFLYGTHVDPDTQVTITPGGTYALYTALTTVLQPGDEVIVFEPAYDSYIPAIEVNGAVAVTVQLTFPGYRIDWKEVQARVSPKTRMIVINSPHNPTGSVLSPEDLQELERLVQGTNILVLSDEVYEHLVFDGREHESVLKYPGLLQRSFVCFSFGKNYHCTGWKLGYCVAPPALMAEFRKIHQFNCFSCDTPKQVALAQFLHNRDAYLQLKTDMQAKRDYFRDLMAATRFEPLPSYGSYFQCYSYAAISEESEKDFALRITREYGVATIPVAAFYRRETNHQVVRFCFAKKEETLEAAAERLRKL